MSVIHIVLFKLKSDLSDAEIKDASTFSVCTELVADLTQFCDDMLSLRTRCCHPSSSNPYIVSSSGGRDNSPEGAQGGFTHGFVVEFASEEDRDYYVSQDPEHQAFVKKNKPSIEDVRVIDYTKGVY